MAVAGYQQRGRGSSCSGPRGGGGGGGGGSRSGLGRREGAITNYCNCRGSMGPGVEEGQDNSQLGSSGIGEYRL